MNVSDTSTQVLQYVKDHKKELCEKFASIEIYPLVKDPSAYFMAGSPGAGKTEYSKSFIEQLEAKFSERKIVRIDADEVRDSIPTYDRTNAPLMQRAAALGVEKLLDCVFKNHTLISIKLLII